MNIKDHVLRRLYGASISDNQYVSGEEISEELGVSRMAVSKAVKQLVEEGNEIEAVTKKGYRLLSITKELSEAGVIAGLCEELKDIPVHVYEVTESTNKNAMDDIVNQNMNEMDPEKKFKTALYIAKNQTAGRGRLGRSFVTFPGRNIYFSMVLTPGELVGNNNSDIVYITTAASIAVLRAVKKVCGIELEIKWVNDLYYKNRKICGILTQAVSNFEAGHIEQVVLGIGINFVVRQEDFPAELKDIAGALYEEEGDEVPSVSLLSAEIANELIELAKGLSEHTFIEDYKKHSMIIGKKISLQNRAIAGGELKYAIAEDIDETGGLVVRFEDGSVETLHTGEVSIRKAD